MSSSTSSSEDIPSAISRAASACSSQDQDDKPIKEGNVRENLLENLSRFYYEMHEIRECQCDDACMNWSKIEKNLLKDENEINMRVLVEKCNTCYKKKVKLNFLINFPLDDSEKPQKPKLSLPFEENEDLIMTYFNRGNSVYLRPGNDEANKLYNDVVEKVQEAGILAPPVNRHLSVGEIFICLSKNDNMYRRAVVISTDNKPLRFFCMDTGEVMKNHGDVREISDCLKILPTLIKEVKLHNVEIRKPQPKVIQLTKEFIEKQCLFRGQWVDDKLVLLLQPNLENINDKMRYLQKSSDSRIPLKDCLIWKDLKDVWRRSSENEMKMRVLHISESDENLFYCILLDDLEKLAQLTKGIKEYCGVNKDPYLPQVDEVCLALYEGEFYRAVVENVNRFNVRVNFIDYGNNSTITMGDVRKIIPEFFQNSPVLTYPCRLKDSKGSVEQYAKINISSVEEGNGCYIIQEKM